MHEDVGHARKTNKKQTELPSQIWKGNMKEYFNENERKNHLIITCCQTAIDEMLKTNAPTDEERKALKTAMKKLEEFSISVYARLGDAYRRKILRTNQCNVVRLVGRYAPMENAVSHCAVEDIAPCFERLRMLTCFGCTKFKDHNAVKDCAVYNLGVAVDATGKDDDVCPYNMGEDVGFDGGEE